MKGLNTPLIFFCSPASLRQTQARLLRKRISKRGLGCNRKRPARERSYPYGRLNSLPSGQTLTNCSPRPYSIRLALSISSENR